MPRSDASSCHTTEEDRIRDAKEEEVDDDDEPPPKVVDRDPTGRFVRYAEPLGKGAYKSVWRAFDEDEGVEVAWNQLRVDHLTDLDAGKLRAEVALLSALRHPNVIRLHHAWAARASNGGETVYFVTELMTSGTLKRYLRKTTGSIRPKFLKHICRQVLSGLAYLHTCQPPVIHRDLKCENIFVNGNTGEVKLGDLGLATVKPFRHVTSVIGTPEFMAPELYDEKYDEKVDVYAFGMCVLEMVTKEYPYSECSNQAQIYKKVTNGIKPLALEKIEAGPLRELINICLRFNPDERPSAADLLNHPFLTVDLCTSSESTTCLGLISPDLRRCSIDAGSFFTNSMEASLEGLAQQRASNNHISALSASLISHGTGSDVANNHSPALAMYHSGQLPDLSASSMASSDHNRPSSLGPGQFIQLPGHSGTMDPLQLAQSYITKQMAQTSLMAADAMTAAELNESMSAPSTLRQSGPIPGLAHSLVGQTAAGTRSENASTVGTPGAPSHGQVDFVKRIDTGSLLLKMISRRPGETKHKCIKFPFILEQDTPEDVVNEMVREQVLDEDDRDLAVCNIRCAVERGRLASELAINTAVIGSHNSSESGPMSSSCSSLVGMRRTSSGRSQPDDVHAQLARYHAYHQLVSPALAAMSNGIPSSNAATAGSMHYPANAMLPHLHHSPTDVMSMSPYSNLLPQPVPGHHPHAHHRRSASSGAIPFDLLQHGSSFSHSHLSSSFPSPTPLSASLSDIDNYSPQLPSMRPRGRSYAGDPRLNHEFISMAGHRESSHLAPIYTTDRNMNDAFFSSRRGQTPTTPNDVYVDYREAAAPMSRRTSTHSQHQLASLAAAKVKQMAASTSGRAVLQQQQQQQHAYETSMLHLARARGISFASSPRSEHGDLTTDGTVATGDTSLISPLFGSPRFDDEVSASASSPGDLKEIGITNKSSSGFAEVLVARSPSTAGIGVVVMDSSIDSLSLSNDPTLRPHPQSLTHNLNSNSSTNSHANSLSIGIPQLNGTDLSTYPISPLNCVDNNSNSNNDTVADVDVSDPKLIELWEKQRREAEEMARTHMVEWEQLVQDLREKRVTDRSTPSITANTAT